VPVNQRYDAAVDHLPEEDWITHLLFVHELGDSLPIKFLLAEVEEIDLPGKTGLAGEILRNTRDQQHLPRRALNVRLGKKLTITITIAKNANGLDLTLSACVQCAILSCGVGFTAFFQA
jgi:hypothetical protein